MDESTEAVKYVAEILDAVARKYPNQTAPMPTDIYMEDNFNRLNLVVEDQIIASDRGYLWMQDVYLVDNRSFVAVGYCVGHSSFGPKDWTAYAVHEVKTTKFVSV